MDIIENLLMANFIKMDSQESKLRRTTHQQDAFIKLKMLSYIAMTAGHAGCITLKQYQQIALQISEVIKLTSAWKKSDDERWTKTEDTEKV